MPDFPYKRAIITGATSGIGEEYALQLAGLSEEIIITGRREDRLTLVKEAMTRINPKLKTICYPIDLTNGEQLQEFIAFIETSRPLPTLFINNAGLGDYGEFQTAEWEKVEAMLLLNIATLTKFCHSILPSLKAHGGGIINISSLASSLPIPDFAVYAASKSYVLSFSEALRLELKNEGIHVVAVCPGPVSTEFGQVARRSGFTGNMMPGRNFFDTSKYTVVAESLKAIVVNKPRVYPGVKIKFSAGLLALLPMPLLRLIMGRRPRKSLPLLPENNEI